MQYGTVPAEWINYFVREFLAELYTYPRRAETERHSVKPMGGTDHVGSRLPGAHLVPAEAQHIPVRGAV